MTADPHPCFRDEVTTSAALRFRVLLQFVQFSEVFRLFIALVPTVFFPPQGLRSSGLCFDIEKEESKELERSGSGGGPWCCEGPFPDSEKQSFDVVDKYPETPNVKIDRGSC